MVNGRYKKNGLSLFWVTNSRASFFEQVVGEGVAGLAVVAGEFDPFVVPVDVGRVMAMGVPLTVVAEEQVEAVFHGAAGRVEHTQAPFAHAAAGVAFVFQ